MQRATQAHSTLREEVQSTFETEQIIEQAGLLEHLAEIIMYHAFTALNAWDTAGVYVPQVG